MKVSKLNWRITTLALLIGSGMMVASCNDENKSGNPSTPEADTSTSTATAPANDTAGMNSMNTSGNTGTATARKGKGKVSVAMGGADKATKMEMDKSGYYNYAETMPSYRGGQRGIEDYVNDHIEYPQQAIDNNIEGTVQVRFGIDEKGHVTNVQTIGPKVGYGLEEEAVRVINDMPSWAPGEVKGKKVKTWMVLPITYRIES